MNTNRAEYLPHSGVLVGEVTSIVKALPKGLFIDATYGYGSHFQTFKDYKDLDLLGFDRDPEAIAAKKNDDNVIKLNFSEISGYLNDTESTPISGIFYDFGLSSHQIDKSERGFSFQQNADLDMRMDNTGLSASDLLNTYKEILDCKSTLVCIPVSKIDRRLANLAKTLCTRLIRAVKSFWYSEYNCLLLESRT